MKRALLPPRLVALLFGTGGTLAWNKREALHREEASFTARQLTLLEAENARLRGALEKHIDTARASRTVEQRQEIETRTARLRGLEFEKPVAYETLSRSALKEKLVTLFDREYTQAQFDAMQQGYIAMGLIPEGTNLKEVILHLLDEQIAAFYDQHAGELFMFENSSLDSAQDRMILSHELVHALQDQHFDLSSLPIEQKDNDDVALAAFSLVEGEATVVMQEFLQGELSLKGTGQLLKAAFTQKYEQLAKAPAFLRESLLFRYQVGATFCQAIMEERGYDALSDAYSRLPASTSQILHPAKYLAGEEPLAIAWKNTEFNGRPPSFENVAGEFGVQILLKEWGFQKSEAERLATGWRGDRYLYWHEAGALVWKSAWESPAKAQEMAGALKALLGRRYNATFEGNEGKMTAANAAAPRGLAVLQPSATEVLLVNVAGADRLPALLRQFGEPLP